MGIAIITGASSGLGMEFARQLKARGKVDGFWFVARREERMRELAEELGLPAKIIAADLCESDGVDAIKAALRQEKPEVSYLINAAGFGVFGAFDEVSEEHVERMIDLNVKALVLITHAVIPFMVRGGRIIELGSASAFTPLPNFNVYASSKSFVLHYTKALNHEIKKYGLRATCFCPGWVATEFIGNATCQSGVHRPKKMKPLLSKEKVVSGCLKAAERGRAMYVTNWFTKLQHLMSKLIPDSILTGIWVGMQVED